jgi:hypothetical protein
MPPENFTKVDTPVLRSARDALMLQGAGHVVQLASAARMILNYDRYGHGLWDKRNNTKYSNDAIVNFVNAAGDDLIAAVDRSRQIRKEITIVASGLITAIYLIRREIGPDDPRVARFFDDIENGLDISKTDVVYLLRRMFNQRAGQGRPNQYLALALIIKAWNARATGRHLQQLVWRNNESFPATIIVPAPETT